VDPNYFYGEFLYDEGEYEMSYEYLHKAQKAPARKARLIADKYRQNEIQVLLTEGRKKISL